MTTKEMLPGFLLTIEDTGSGTTVTPIVDEVTVIYANLPEVLKYEDEDGEIYDKFIEPNKPLLITSTSEAIKTLELSDIALTREVKNMIKLLPTGTNIAICRIVKRNGERPDSLIDTEMKEALNFAFDSTQNYPIREMYFAEMSLDRVLRLTNNFTEIKDVTSIPVDEDMEVAMVELNSPIFSYVENINGTSSLAYDTFADVRIELSRDLVAPTAVDPFNKFTFMINGIVAKFVLAKGVIGPDAVFRFTHTLGLEDKIESSVMTPIDGLNVTGTVTETTKGNIVFNFTGGFKLLLNEDTIVELPNNLTFTLKDDGRTDVNSQERIAINKHKISKLSSSSDLLTEIMLHNQLITSTMNNCLTFLSPESAVNASNQELKNYVTKCEDFYQKIRDRIGAAVFQGRKLDLGMYLNVAVGSNQIDGLGGLYNFPQSTVNTIVVDPTSETSKVTTKKNTDSFAEGDIVEIFTYEKLNINTVKAVVKNVKLDAAGNTVITVDGTVSLMNPTSPIYIMNVNNKDFNGNYLAIMYSNACRTAGVKISPAAIKWPGSCHMSFSNAQIQLLESKKYCVLNPVIGTTTGQITRSQLMTGATSRFQKYESIATVYNLSKGSKDIALKYKGQRVSDSDLAIIQKEIDDAVFKPAVDEFITTSYNLTLRNGYLTHPNGVKEKALYIDYSVTEIETLQLIRITAKLY